MYNIICLFAKMFWLKSYIWLQLKAAALCPSSLFAESGRSLGPFSPSFRQTHHLSAFISLFVIMSSAAKCQTYKHSQDEQNRGLWYVLPRADANKGQG